MGDIEEAKKIYNSRNYSRSLNKLLADNDMISTTVEIIQGL